MNKVTFPLKSGSQGAAVGDLQDALQACLDRKAILANDDGARRELMALLRRERANQTYSDGTAKLVSIFQEGRNIPPSGVVDEPTANALNGLLKEWGLLDPATPPPGPAVPQSFVVSGQVQRDDGTPLPGMRVRAVHATGSRPVRLGEDTSDAGGLYTIRYDQVPGVDQINLQVSAFDVDGNLLVESPVSAGAKPLEVVDLTVPGDALKQYQVVGKVSSRAGAGIGSLRVVIVDKGIGGDAQLAQATTAENGDYQAGFSDSVVRRRGKAQPDLQARVFSGDTFAGASEVRYNASEQETLDVQLADEVTATLQSEHEVLTRVIAGQYKGRLGALQETDDRQDITYLANKTGWDARAVALAALADQFSAQTATPAGDQAIPQEYFYALFRAGLPANEDTLYLADTGTLESVWQQAADQGVISKAAGGQIPNMVKRFQQATAQKMLTLPAQVGTSSLKEMLAASNLNDAQQEKFAELYTENRTDMTDFWKAIGTALGPQTANRLQVDGKLGFLTINNAQLMQKLHSAAGDNGLSDPLQLAQQGYYRADQWNRLLDANVAVPKEIPGDNDAARRANYADYLAAQVRVSYPTASIAQMVKTGELPLAAQVDGIAGKVNAFLTEQQGKFEIGVQPVQQYVAKNNVQIDGETLQQVQRIQRVYQLTPNDQAMAGLMKNGLDAAFHITRYDKDSFIQTYQRELGGTQVAAQTYDRSVQVFNSVLNIAVSYMTAKNGINIGSKRLEPAQQGHANAGQIVQPGPNPPADPNASGVIAYPTLEGLFGSMDFCACDHCRSVLSPAAYLVDLLLFIDQPHPPAGSENPQTVLLERRPDIQHLPLTCENTNTALPYIDVVNETLEYFIANSVQKLSLQNYIGHDTGEAASADLLASPQYVMDAAYTILRAERFPMPLPFHQPLENLRRYFDKFGSPLPLVMEQLRKDDALERGANAYGWRDILMEVLLLSRDEYEILSDSVAVPLWRLYGFPNGTADADVIAVLSNAKEYSRRVGISYEDLVAILQTRFVNPQSDLVPKLERLGVSFATLQAFKDGTLSDAEFDALLPQGTQAPDPAEYGGDIKAWVKNDDNFARMMGLITLSALRGNTETCGFGDFELRFAKPIANAQDTSTRLGATEFVRLMRFIRLWKKLESTLNWTLDQTDAAICALYRDDLAPISGDDTGTLARLDAGFLTLLPRLAMLVRVMQALHLSPKRDLRSLLACWSEIGTHGASALYRTMFLNPSLLQQDPVFADNGYGEFLADATKKLADHAEALRTAFNLTGDEYDRIVSALGYDAETPLTIASISAIFRRGWLARKMKISVRELLLLIQYTGLDPFAAPDPTQPAILQLIALVLAVKDRSFKTTAALYLIWNQDLSGKSAPDPAKVTQLARTLRGDFAAIDDQLAAVEDPGGDIARARMALVYGQETTDLFFALLDDTLSLDVAYTHPQPALEAAITAADPKLAYDDFRHRLSRSGRLSVALRDALKNVAGVPAAFQEAVDALYDRGEDTGGSFFAGHPELKPLYDTYVASADPVEKKRTALLAAFQPELARRRKQQQALQRLSAAAGIDLPFTQTILDAPVAPYPLHAEGQAGTPALDDVLALGTAGLSAGFFFRDTATGAPDLTVAAVPIPAYAPGSDNVLPANPAAGAAISGVWSGQVETPEAGFYNFVIEADAGAAVKLQLDGVDRPLIQNGTVWRNNDPLELKAGMLYPIAVTVEKVSNTVKIKWETPSRAREIIPSRYLYPPSVLTPFQSTYTRFLKATSLATALHLTANELAHFATDADYRITGDGWLNLLPVSGDPTPAVAAALLKPLQALLDFARIKAALSPADESVLGVLSDPATATAQADSLLFALTHWDRTSLNDVLAHFGSTVGGLAHFDMFRRVYDAFTSIQMMGIPAAVLIAATTNEPDGNLVRTVQAALRARYDPADWRDVVQPVNDALRGLQRDALVAYILHQMIANPATAHIDTADKLFEYFLMDVLMEPCMQTSRIRHALSTVQLFIERCLMNLEPNVSPAAINAQQWDWMKRYRVWEANRKIFLWPENWLEPELRDDKSPFFKEIESELLQSDITEDSATTALLNYLSKLEEVAKLEPCGIYHIEANPNRRTGEIDHVIARTSGAKRKYYYRRREYGSWTPWEEIKLDIEDNPVVPIVWKDRLLLFWLRILKQNQDSAQKPFSKSGKLTELKTSDIKTDPPEVKVQAVLCWSEYYNNKWQPTKTSDVDRPTNLGTFPAAGDEAFDRSAVYLSSVEEGSEHFLRVSIEGGVYSTFLVFNTHSLPAREEDVSHDVQAMFIGERYIDAHTNQLRIEYYKFSDGSTLKRTLLSNDLPDRVVETKHPVRNIWTAPFFYEDNRHVFFVTTEQERIGILNHDKYGIWDKPGLWQKLEIPPLVFQPNPQVKQPPKFLGDGGAVIRDPGIIDPEPMRRFVTEDAYIGRGIGTTGDVVYGTRKIGPAGSIAKLD